MGDNLGMNQQAPSSRSRVWLGVLVGIPLLSVTTLLILSGQAYDAKRPPEDARSLEAFAAEMAPPAQLAMIEMDEATYFVWVGKQDRWFPGSGPPGYVFDRSGTLIDYSLDTGDDHHISAYMTASWKAQATTVAEAVQIIAQEG